MKKRQILCALLAMNLCCLAVVENVGATAGPIEIEAEQRVVEVELTPDTAINAPTMETIEVTETIEEIEVVETEIAVERVELAEELEPEIETAMDQATEAPALMAEEAAPEIAAIAETVVPQQPTLYIENIGCVSANGAPVAPVLRIGGSLHEKSDLTVRLVDGAGREVQVGGELVKDKAGLCYRVSTIDSDGIYTLTATATDDRGNQMEVKRVFTINIAGTSFVYNPKQNYRYPAEKIVPEITVENIDEIVVLSCENNGKEVNYQLREGKLVIDRQEFVRGKNRITLEVRDGAGNVSVMKPWEFYVSQKNGKNMAARLASPPTIKRGLVGKIWSFFWRPHI